MTELIWDGKYDARGKRVAPVRVALPFQTVETVNEPAGTRQLMLDLFSQGRDPEWRNRLIWGDKKYVLPALLPEFAGKIDLIYIDPPFDTGADFSFTTQIPDSDASFTKEPSMIEQKAYRDTWGRGLDSYLQWFYETAVLLHELLSENGSIYVHLDWHVGHYAKTVLDEVFGIDNFQNEIVWKRTTAHNDSKTWSHVTDVIFFYKHGGGQIAWNTPYNAHKEAYLSDKYSQVEADGRRYQLDNLTSPNPRPNMTYEWKGHKPPANGWRYSKETMAQLDEGGRIWYPDSKDKRPRLKRYLDESKGELLDNLWEDIPPVNSQAEDRTGYRTQKPLALLERIITASSNPGDLVLDCFCGSGTTAVAAESLGRRWITCDLGRFAIQTARKRLLAMPNVRPFMVQNLGKYERQAWQAAEFAADDQRAAGLAAYRRFILDLYRATPLDGYAYLHGLRAGRFVYVGSVDAPVTAEDVKAVARECWKASGRVDDASNAADVLGWDFAFEVNETAKAIAADANIKLSFKRIPREVLEKKAVEQGDIRFFELAALSLDLAHHGDTVTLSLTDFMIPPDDVPQDVARAISHWSQWIDYWAVDWDFRDDTFHNQWQSYRTRKDPTLQRQVAHAYDAPGRYCIVVKVIDILGNDTTKSVTVEVE